MNNVVVCPEPLAADAGAVIFNKGGSAIDAAIATAYTQAVIDPAMASIGGTGVMQTFHPPSDQHVILDFMGFAGSGARHDAIQYGSEEELLVGYQSILVPTFVHGTYTAYKLFGSGNVSWPEILEPAIRHAFDGFPVYQYLHKYWRARDPIQQTNAVFDAFQMLNTTSACAEIFTVDKQVHGLGEYIIQSDLGNTLQRIADGGQKPSTAGRSHH